MTINRFRALSAEGRALVAVAVLLDGHEAEHYLASDAQKGSAYAKAAKELANQKPDLRMPLVGSLLRGALKELKERGFQD